MVEILNSGLIANEDHLTQLAQRYQHIVIPNENDELELSHWWAITDDGEEVLYVGTPDTFATYVKERNGGIQ